MLDKNTLPSEQTSRNDAPPKDSNGALVVRRPVMEISGEVKEADEDEDDTKGSSIDAGLTRFAKKMPLFEPKRVESEPKEKPLTVNLDLALYKAKVLGRKFRYEEAEQILQKVCVVFDQFGYCLLFEVYLICVSDYGFCCLCFEWIGNGSVYAVGQKMVELMWHLGRF